MAGSYTRWNVILTAQNGNERFLKKEDLLFSKGSPSAGITVSCDLSRKYQEIIGFGGALTEAVAYNLLHLSRENREKLLQGYFNAVEGMGYNLCRIHMNSSDFCLDNYSCDDVDGDVELKHFNIERDKKYTIPIIREALAINKNIRILMSPWSPPPWMKTTGKMNHGGKLKPEYRETWALFFTKFIRAYEAEGIPIWATTVQNEPLATQRWDSCIYTAEEERDFVRDYLGPALHRAGLERIKVLVWDHNRDLMYKRSKIILSDPEAAKYVWGIGFHWYSGEQFDIVRQCHEEFPDKKLIFTEGCHEGGVKLGRWDRGERYGKNIIGDLNSGTHGWIDWNIVLDCGGGPNHAENFCDSPIIVDPPKNIIHYQNSFYYLGHFFKYIRPGATRIRCESNSEDLQTTGFLNRDGTCAIIVLNLTDKPVEYSIHLNGNACRTIIPEHAIKTLVSRN
ncbi:MAG: glycoside hydrolase family 30 protein [Spirochaetales bacterium]|nr:glycoside hydrolase family 30 protein [Spirochaetales bacterium]